MLRTLVFVTTLPITTALTCSAQTGSAAPQHIQTALTELDTFVREAMARTAVPGLAVAVVYKDQVVFLKGYGVRRIGEPALVNPDTVFELASLSKPISSTIVAALVGTGDVGWDERIADLDPGFKLLDPAASQNVTIRDMFAHRSGLPTGSGDVLEDLGYSRPEVLQRLRLVPPAGEFRTTYHYSNFGLTEGAIAASKKIGKSWEEIASQRLYARIGMRSTSSRYSDYENNPNKAALHVLENGVYRNRFIREADSESPAGGVSSTVRDLAEWVRLQIGNGSWNGRQIVAEKALAETHKPQICRSVPGPVATGQCPGNQYYGLGWNVETDAKGTTTRLSHSGAFLLGTGTSVYIEPGEQIGIVALGNSTPVGLPEAVCLSFLDFFHHGAAKADYVTVLAPIFADMRKSTQDSSPDYSQAAPPENPSPSKPLASYKGRYFNPYYGKLEIDAEHNHLVLRLPPRGAYYELTHWDRDTFTYYFASENTGIARRGVKFSGDGTQVLIENLAIINNNGIFTKVD